MFPIVLEWLTTSAELVVGKVVKTSEDEKEISFQLNKNSFGKSCEEDNEKSNETIVDEETVEKSELLQTNDKEEKVAIGKSDEDVFEPNTQNEGQGRNEVVEQEEEITFVEQLNWKQNGSAGLMLLNSYDDIDIADADNVESLDESSVEVVSDQENENNSAKVEQSSYNDDDGEVLVLEENISEVVQFEPVNETFTESAKLVQLKKGNEWGKVVEAMFELTSGKLAKEEVVVANDLVYIWGHHLSKANLMINLKFEDECSVRYKLKTKDDTSLIQIERLWFGSQSSSPARAEGDPGFAAWLNQRKLTEKDFLKWIRNQVPPQPYFPLRSEIFCCKVVEFVQVEETNFCSSKVLLQIGDIFGGDISNKCTQLNGEIDQSKQVSMPENGVKSDKENGRIAMLSREDFYVGGVSVGYSNLRNLLRRGDLINCQIRETADGEKDADMPNIVTHIAYLGFIGSERPTKANLSPAFARNLENDLKILGLTVSEFEALRFPIQTNGDSADLSDDKKNYEYFFVRDFIVHYRGR